MTDFPLGPFLDSIKDDIPVRVRDYERMSLALMGDGPWTVERLKDVLLALLVKNPDQQLIFLRRFDAFFPPDAEAELDGREIDRVIENLKVLSRQQESPEPSHISDTEKSIPLHETTVDSRFNWQIPAWIVLTVCIVFGFIWFFQPGVESEAPVLTCNPDSLVFDDLKPRQSETQSITLTNNGPGVARIINVDSIGPHADVFHPRDKSFPRQLAEKESCAIATTFNPQAGGPHTAFLDIEYNSQESPMRVPMKGFVTEDKSSPDPGPTRKRIYRNMPYVEKVEFHDLPDESTRWILYACIAAVFLTAAVFYGLHVQRSRKIPEDQPAKWDPDGPRHFSMASIGGEHSPILDKDLLDHLADSMGYFQSDRTGKTVDVPASIEATVGECGIPSIVFHKRIQIRSLLILENNFAEAPAWNPIARELAAGMRKRGVPLIHGWYDKTPDLFITAEGSTHRLEDLEDQRRGHLVLIFTEGGVGAGRGNAFALERLARWPMAAWMDYNETPFRDETSTIPRNLGIPVFPATPEGVQRAVEKFLTERGADKALPGDKSQRRSPMEIPERFDAYVEYLLGDALPWAQDCAMIQPTPTGLADAIRKRFHPHLPPGRMGRLFALPDVTNTISGIRFSSEVETVLRSGFKSRRKNREQEEVLRFILEKIREAKPLVDPGGEPGLDHLKWESVVERLEMELNPNSDLARFAALAKTPLGPGIAADLAPYDFRGEEGKIPLRVKPKNPEGLQRLANMERNPLDIPKLEAFPIKPVQWITLCMVVLLFVGFSGLGLYEYSESLKPAPNWSIIGEPNVYGRLEKKQGEDWVFDRSWQGKPPPDPLAANSEYRIILYDNGYRTIKTFKTKQNQGIFFTIKRENKYADCIKEYPEIGLIALRCPESELSVGEPLEIKTWKEILGERTPKGRLMSVGIEFEWDEQVNALTSRLRNALLETSSVDVLYLAYKDTLPLGEIQSDLAPWIDKSQLVALNLWGGLLMYKTPSPWFESEIGIQLPLNLSLLQWIDEVTSIFKPGEDIFISESELLNVIGYHKIEKSGAPIALIRPRKESSAAVEGEPGSKEAIAVGEFATKEWKTLKFNKSVIHVGFSSKNLFIWDGNVVYVYDYNFNEIWSIKEAKTKKWPPNVAVTSEGKIIAFPFYKGEKNIGIFDLSLKKHIQTIEDAHSDYIMHLAFSSDGKFLASGSYDGTVKIWELSSGKFSELQTLKEHSGSVVGIHFSLDGKFLASGSTDHTIRIWKISSGKFSELQILKGHSGIVYSVQFSPDGKYLVSGTTGRTANVWQLSSGKYSEMQTFEVHTVWLNSVHFSPDGKYLASGSDDGVVKIWEFSSGKFSELQTLKRHTGRVFSVHFSPDGKYLASGSSDNTVKIWELTGIGDRETH